MKMTPYYDRDGITIWCGDCLEIMPGLDDIDSLISDVPYGIDFDTDYTRFSGGASEQHRHRHIAGDDKAFDPSHLLKHRRVALFGANTFALPIGAYLVWDKRTPGANKNVMADAEIAWLNSGHGVYIFEHSWDGFNRASERGTNYHPAQKPVAVMQWIIQKVRPQGLICDPYMGSGSTLVAAQREGRRAGGIELSEEYCQTAVERLRQPGFFSLPQQTNGKPKPRQLALEFEDNHAR